MKTKSYDVAIIGAGLSGLSAAHFIRKFYPNLSIVLLEKSERAGGAIQTVHQDGFLAEWGAHGFLDNTPESRELLDDLNLMQEAQKANLKQFARYVCLKGKLVELPQTPPKVIKSNILPISSKLRVLADLWKKAIPAEQSIADWVTYRFGQATLPIADIAMTGTFAGDINKLSIDAAMPGLRRLELETGSVIRGAIKSKKKKNSSGLPSMISFSQGVSRLIEKLAENKEIIYNSPVETVQFGEDGCLVTSNNQAIQSKQVVLATHINQALPILNEIVPAPRLSVTEAKIINIVMGFGSEADIPFAFGYLSPKNERRFALGTLFPSQMFNGRSPNGMKSLEVLIGGTRNPDRLELSDEQLANSAYEDIRQLLHLPHPPKFVKVLRPKAGIPQLELGHLELQTYRDQLQTAHPALHICGFGWEGIGINEMIKNAREAAEKLLKTTPGAKQPAQAKPIYF